MGKRTDSSLKPSLQSNMCCRRIVIFAVGKHFLDILHHTKFSVFLDFEDKKDVDCQTRLTIQMLIFQVFIQH